jgi:hypothetical protein
MVGGVVSSRLLPIYLAICNKSPLLLAVDFDSCDAFVLTKSNSRRSVVNKGDDDAAGKGEGTRLHKYSTAHHRLVELCKDHEDIFGLRVFGHKISLQIMIQMFAVYYTVVTLVLN